MQSKPYDIAIIGGGPAGLQAALVLARTRKRIVVFDDPQPPRNAASHGVHNFLGLDGVLPAEIREMAWKQIDVYQSAELRPERIVDIQRQDDDYFQVTSANGSIILASQVILTVGYHDIYPEIPGFLACWGDTIIPCPFCDGYENRDRVWAVVVSNGKDVEHLSGLVPNWTSDFKLILLPGVTVESAYRQKLINAGVPIHQGAITQVHHANGKVTAVSLDTGEQIEAGTIWWSPPRQPAPLIHNLVENMGLEVDDNAYVKTDDMQRTNVKGLWAAGDVQGWPSVVKAVNSGDTAAVMIIREWHQLHGSH